VLPAALRTLSRLCWVIKFSNPLLGKDRVLKKGDGV